MDASSAAGALPQYHRKSPKPVTARALRRLSIIARVGNDSEVEIEINERFAGMKWPLKQIKPIPAQVAALLRTRRRLLMALSLLMAGAVLVAAWEVKRRAEREIDAARASLEKLSFVPFEKDVRRAFAANEVKLIQSSRSVRGLAQLNGAVFAATDGGLVEFDQDGRVKRRYTTLDGLPESDLTSISAFNSQLFIGSRSQGLIVFDGERFERYRWTDRDAQAVTALLENRGRLLVGAFAGGLLEFDGRRFTEIKAGSDRKRLAGINRLVVDGSRLFVGTFNDGLWINDGGRWSHFTIADGLPSNRIVGVVVEGDRLIVASDFGVAAASLDQLPGGADSSQKRFQTIVTLPELSSAIGYGGGVLLCKDNGELFRLAPDTQDSNRIQLSPLAWKRPESLSSCQLTAFAKDNQPMGETFWLTGNEGVWRASWQDERLSGTPKVSRFDEQAPSALTNNLISALAFDDMGRLWAGSFRNGIDVIAPSGVLAGVLDGRRIAHLESDAHEINALVWDEKSKRMLAATAQGLISFDASFASRRIGAADGLLSNSILSAALIQSRDRASLALATSRGLSLGDAKQWRVLTTIQGLPSNSVYSVLSHREFIYAGTLGGLAQIAGGRVVRVFKDSNSKLAQNWVTALCETSGRLFVGTYGGGVFELTPAGEFVSFASEIGKRTINPNAMASDGKRLYVGALDGAWILDMRSQRWTRLKDELPSSAVLSVAVDDEHVYFGATSGIARVDKSYLNGVKE
jgi:ligand-binding sensor domain-containing protein